MCSSRPGTICECGIAKVAMPSVRSGVEADFASLRVDGAGSRDSVGGVDVEEKDRVSQGWVRRALPWRPVTDGRPSFVKMVPCLR